MPRSIPALVAFCLGGTLLLGSFPAEARSSFGGFVCHHGCRQYAKGYRWAERAHVRDPNQCQITNSKAFRAGCLVYIQDPARGADTDDDGNEI
jgi:hypothetical protein